MANQRMYIKCKVCGEEKFFAKRMMSSFYMIGEPSKTDWEEWFEKHEWGACGEGSDVLDCFELSYEVEKY